MCMSANKCLRDIKKNVQDKVKDTLRVHNLLSLIFALFIKNKMDPQKHFFSSVYDLVWWLMTLEGQEQSGLRWYTRLMLLQTCCTFLWHYTLVTFFSGAVRIRPCKKKKNADNLSQFWNSTLFPRKLNCDSLLEKKKTSLVPVADFHSSVQYLWEFNSLVR